MLPYRNPLKTHSSSIKTITSKKLCQVLRFKSHKYNPIEPVIPNENVLIGSVTVSLTGKKEEEENQWKKKVVKEKKKENPDSNDSADWGGAPLDAEERHRSSTVVYRRLVRAENHLQDARDTEREREREREAISVARQCLDSDR